MIKCSRFLFSILLAGTVSLVSAATPGPSRLDLFDSADNPLMFVVFGYDTFGTNTGRTVYMADSTFVRRTVIERNESGKPARDVSYNFNDDTSYLATYSYTGSKVAMSLHDAHKMDQIGGTVSYEDNSARNVPMLFSPEERTALTLDYVADTAGTVSRVNIADRSGQIQYYGVFTWGDVLPVKRGRLMASGTPTAQMRQRGGQGLGITFTLPFASEVSVDLLTLSGRKLQTVYRENLDKGSFIKTVQPGQAVARGVYVLAITINGKCVMSARYLHQPLFAGGVR